MSTTDLLARLAKLGVSVRLAAPDKLGLAPAARISDDLRREVVAHKPELITVLAARQSLQAWAGSLPPPVGHRRVGEDPRPDLPGSPLWSCLLALAATEADDPRGLYGCLHGFRCCGAVLKPYQGRWRLAPTIDPSERVSIWHSRESWDRDCSEWLRPHVARLRELLAQVPMPSPRFG